MTVDEIVQYWLDGAKDNQKSSLNMYSNGEYVWSLFIGHLALEKLLKAYCVKTKGINVLRTHDLFKLANYAKLSLSDDQQDDLQYITLFNIEARYEEYKRDFSRKCTREYAYVNLKKIKRLREWLLRKIEK